MVPTTDEKWYLSELWNRLYTIRHIHGIFPTCNLSLSHLEFLWQLVHNEPVEIDLFFKMLKSGITTNTTSSVITNSLTSYNSLNNLSGGGGYLPNSNITMTSMRPFQNKTNSNNNNNNDLYLIAEIPVFIEIYHKVICDSNIDWSLLTDDSFYCFQTFFILLHPYSGFHLTNTNSISSSSIHDFLTTSSSTTIDSTSIISIGGTNISTTALDNMNTLTSPDPTELPPYYGLDTLWKIVFYLPVNPLQPLNIQKTIFELLITTYEELYKDNNDIHEVMTERIFTHLKDLMASYKLLVNKKIEISNSTTNTYNTNTTTTSDSINIITTNNNNPLLTNISTENDSITVIENNLLITTEYIHRTLELLDLAILRSQPSITLSHALCSTMSRIKINIYYRKIFTNTYLYNNFNPNSYTNNNSSSSNKTPNSNITNNNNNSEQSFTIETHPMELFITLKGKIATLVGLPSSSLLTFDYIGFKNTNDQYGRLIDYGITDGVEIACSASISSNYNNNNLSYDFSQSNEILDIRILPSVSTYISTKTEYFDILLSLADLHADLKLSWKLLMSLPTQLALLERIERTCDESLTYIQSMNTNTSTNSSTNNTSTTLSDDVNKVTPPWYQLLLSSSLSSYKKTYLLQIIDILLIPGPELLQQDDFVLEKSETFKTKFLNSGGFTAVLQVFITWPTSNNNSHANNNNNSNTITTTAINNKSNNNTSGSDEITNIALAVTLHILHHLMFEEPSSSPKEDSSALEEHSSLPKELSLSNINLNMNNNHTPTVVTNNNNVSADESIYTSTTSSNNESMSLTPNLLLFNLFKQHTDMAIEKLLNIASYAASEEESRLAREALSTLHFLLQSSEAAVQLINNTKSKILLITLLKSQSTSVREMACEFAIQVGRSQPIVFQWLLHEIKDINDYDNNCYELFRAINILMFEIYISSPVETINWIEFANILINKLIYFSQLNINTIPVPTTTTTSNTTADTNITSQNINNNNSTTATINTTNTNNNTTTTTTLLGDNKVLLSYMDLLDRLIKLHIDDLNHHNSVNAILNNNNNKGDSNNTYIRPSKDTATTTTYSDTLLQGVDFIPLTKVLLNKYLFAFPSVNNHDTTTTTNNNNTNNTNESSAICESVTSKQILFSLLHSLSAISSSTFILIFENIKLLFSQTTGILSDRWNHPVSYDVRRTDIQFLGLKNQGCTCYINALIQQLFMNINFRESVLKTPIKECYRSTTSHRTGQDLVGYYLDIEWCNHTFHRAKVIKYSSEYHAHTIEYIENNKISDPITYNLNHGRSGIETGFFLIAKINGDISITEKEIYAYRILEHIQRAFCYMKLSKRRYFDPRPFVEACKTLNLNFNVFHQNDASEFCDQLLDRIEIATKGLYHLQNTNNNKTITTNTTNITDENDDDRWNNIFQKVVFGGKFLYQKIPQDCDMYEKDKRLCGHWQSSRQESFLKIELIIRGKENINDSLSDLVAGELMDGDNKINCEVCTKKKVTTRRTCFDTLPNTLILHLKRFDLDFTTFETVKLNNRLAFELNLNLMKYTKEGIEQEKKLAAKASLDDSTVLDQTDNNDNTNNRTSNNANSNNNDKYMSANNDDDSEEELELDPLDYEYELQGVLVHAGVAQGGHYYSFIRDTTISTSPTSATTGTATSTGINTNDQKWYKFDDEDVTQFSADQIPLQCFGGSSSSHLNNNNSSNNLYDQIDDRTANALMLFYNKVRPTTLSDPTAMTTNTTTTNTTTTATATTEKKDDSMMSSTTTTTTTATDITLATTTTAVAPSATPSASGSASVIKGSKAIDGYQAFSKEVTDWNHQHLLLRYMSDPDLHTFIRDLIASVVESHKTVVASVHNNTNNDNNTVNANTAATATSTIDSQNPTIVNTAGIDQISTLDLNTSRDSNANNSLNEKLSSPYNSKLYTTPPLFSWYTTDYLIQNNMQKLPYIIAKLGYRYLIDIILHCRERSSMKAWIQVLKSVFIHLPLAAVGFLQYILMGPETHCRYNQFLLNCPDSLARNTFVQIVAQSIISLSHKLHIPSITTADYTKMVSDIISMIQNPSTPLMINIPSDMLTQLSISDTKLIELIKKCYAKFVYKLIESICEAQNYYRTADEIFILLREVASVDCVCSVLIDMLIVSYLIYYATPDNVSIDVATIIESHRHNTNSNSTATSSSRGSLSPRFTTNTTTTTNTTALPHNTQDYHQLLQSVFEALAAILGVPQLKKVSLLQDRLHYENELTAEAKDAFIIIFKECAPRGNMDVNDIIHYRDKMGIKMNTTQARNILDKFHTGSDNRLTLDGFLQLYTDLAAYNPKEAWRDLHLHRFKNDLSRSPLKLMNTSNSHNNPMGLESTMSTTTNNNNTNNNTLDDTNVSEYLETNNVGNINNQARIGTSTLDDVSEYLETNGVGIIHHPTRLDLPDDCRLSLCNLDLFLLGFDVSEMAAKAIARRLCSYDEHSSKILIKDVRYTIYNTQYNF